MIHWDWSIDGWVILVGVLSAISCALPGNFLVLRKLSLMGDAISHAVLPGLAIAFLLSHSRSSWSMFVGAVIVGVLTAVLTQLIMRHGKVEQGAAMGVVFSILFAVGLILIRQAADHVDLDPGCVLYGNIVQVPLDALGGQVPPVVVNLGVVLVVNVLFVGLFYKELKLTAFDPELATTLGIDARWMHYALMVIVAVTTVANFEAVGSILVIAMLIVPGVTAHLLTDRLGIMIVISALLAVASAVLGHVLAAFGPGWLGMNGSANTAAMMAVVTGGFLLIAIAFSPQHGLVATLVRRVALSSQILRQDILGMLFRWEELNRAGGRPAQWSDFHGVLGDSTRTRGAVRYLARHGLIRLAGPIQPSTRLELTPAGSTAGARLIGSHRLWESFLAEHFELAEDHLHEPAERMEHFITPDLRTELREQLTQPATDPHGRRIPGGDDPRLE